LAEAIDYARDGNTLVLWKLDRLGRSLKHLIETVNGLAARKVGFQSLRESMDTTTSGGKLIFHVFGALAESERELIRERTRAGLRAARARGRNGLPPRENGARKISMARALMGRPNAPQPLQDRIHGRLVAELRNLCGCPDMRKLCGIGLTACPTARALQCRGNMDARLVAISGPLEGAVFPLETELSIGRDKTNSISVEDRVLSRRHCLVHREAGGFQIRDLNSSNGTYINGLPVTVQALKSGDHLKAGESVFLFLDGEGAPRAAAMPVELEGGSSFAGATMLVKTGGSQGQGLDRKVKHLEALLQIGSVVASIRDLEELEEKILQSICEVIPADRGAILLGGRPPEEFASTHYWTRKRPASGQPMQVSRTIIERVIREGVALLSNDVFQDSAIAGAQSIIRARIGSLVAVPMTAFEKTLGAIYLDSQTPGIRFSQDDVELLTGIAGVAAAALENALYVETLQRENQRLQAEMNLEHDMVGASPRMRHVFEFISKVAPSGATVLLRGESGTGKELVARAVHRNSPRRGKPFVAINCAALTESLLESELFGHEKGAFTGAVVQKRGKLEEAAGGSVFLDELGELAPALQAKLLRVLQEREFERVGGTRTIKTDIRLIAATNRDLEEAVAAGTFRRDLYYRLNVVSIVLPPLRQRREDIVPLANYLVAKHARNSTRQVVGLSEEARAYLMSYDWPGNVRELENAMERAVVLGSSELILPEDLPESVLETETAAASSGGGFHELVREAKKQIVLRMVQEANGSYAEAAKRLHLHPSNLHRLIRTLNIKDELKK
jgi:Nif-specific regulatory protein